MFQLGPLYSVVLVEKPSGSFAFVEYVDDCSVIFACNMLQDLRLYGRPVVVKPRDKTKKASLFTSFIVLIFYNFRLVNGKI